MTIVFDGKGFANVVIEGLRDKVIEEEKKLGRKLKMVTIYNPEDKASRIYTNIKEKRAEELGVEFEKFSILNFSRIAGSRSAGKFQIKDLVIKLNNDKNVDGIMIQMPLGTGEDQFLIDLIDLKKDVDGLRSESGVIPATVRAVIEILSTSPLSFPSPEFRRGVRGEVIVVGNRGLVGRRLQEELKCKGLDKEDFDPEIIKNADIVISATGQEGLIKPDMIKEGAVCIDVGYPKGDFSPEVAEKAAFFTPVPGGVGPVTVAMLFKNLIELVNGFGISRNS